MDLTEEPDLKWYVVWMHWHTNESQGEVTGLTMTVRTRRPGLVFENLGHRRLRFINQHGVLLRARVLPRMEGIVMAPGKGLAPAVLAPLKSRETRSCKTTLEWMKSMAHALNESEASPLRSGTFCLTEMRADKDAPKSSIWFSMGSDGPPPAYGLGATAAQTSTVVSWGINGSGDVWPLREASENDASRVKAWRKHARDGTLPPILLWWVSALDMHVLIDGHDRLLASQLESVTPRVLTLWEPTNRIIERSPEEQARIIKRYEMVFAKKTNLSRSAIDRLNRSLTSHFKPSWVGVKTTATARPSATKRWMIGVRETVSDPQHLFELCERP